MSGCPVGNFWEACLVEACLLEGNFVEAGFLGHSGVPWGLLGLLGACRGLLLGPIGFLGFRGASWGFLGFPGGFSKSFVVFLAASRGCLVVVVGARVQ